MRYTITLTIHLVVFLNVSTLSLGRVKVPFIISDNMVLQQQTSVPIWGWGSPNEKIVVKPSWSNQTRTTSANSDGKWVVRIETPTAGGPYTITITGNNTIILKDVMIGEVWICSGQSNMEMPVQGWEGQPVTNSENEIKNSNYPYIRLFTVKRNVALEPQEDCEGTWMQCTPQTVANFSATAYFFGKELHQNLKVPIGLIHSSWGGTVAEAWTSSDALRKLNDFDSVLNKLDSIKPNLKQLLAEDERKTIEWNNALKNVKDDYAKENFDDADWKTMTLPTKWEDADYKYLDGIVWFRKEIDIPASWSGKNLKISLGPIDDDDITWFNGKQIGKTELWNANRLYNIPAGLVKRGKAVISIRVIDTGGDGGLWGDKPQLKIYLNDASANDSLSIAGDWKYKIDAVKQPPSVAYNANTPSVLFNGMIAPLIPFAIHGAIWYQGESNVGRAKQYEKLFPTMIADWRSRWNEWEFPFYYVQIAPWSYASDGMQAAALRDAQRKTLNVVPNTGMAVTLDIGSLTTIHPPDKPEVGRRLALWALAKTYGEKNIVYSGPLYKSSKVDGNKIIVSFDYADDGLMLKDNGASNFKIAGEDGNFMEAQASITRNKLVVFSEKISHPAAVRYAWTDTAEATLFNKAGLPASSFSSKK